MYSGSRLCIARMCWGLESRLQPLGAVCWAHRCVKYSMSRSSLTQPPTMAMSDWARWPWLTVMSRRQNTQIINLHFLVGILGETKDMGVNQTETPECSRDGINVILTYSGSFCRQIYVKCCAMHAFRPHNGGRQGDVYTRATQNTETTCSGTQQCDYH